MLYQSGGHFSYPGRNNYSGEEHGVQIFCFRCFFSKGSLAHQC